MAQIYPIISMTTSNYSGATMKSLSLPNFYKQHYPFK